MYTRQAPSAFVVQREGCPWSYATSKGTKEYVKAFDHLKYDGPKKPEKMRETVQLLVPRVKAQRDKWLEQVNTPDKKHQFAAEEVSRGVSLACIKLGTPTLTLILTLTLTSGSYTCLIQILTPLTHQVEESSEHRTKYIPPNPASAK